jgi:hypothetical protein
MNDMAELQGLPSGIAEALANGLLGDPFAVLGPHDTPLGRIDCSGWVICRHRQQRRVLSAANHLA